MDSGILEDIEADELDIPGRRSAARKELQRRAATNQKQLQGLEGDDGEMNDDREQLPHMDDVDMQGPGEDEPAQHVEGGAYTTKNEKPIKTKAQKFDDMTEQDKSEKSSDTKCSKDSEGELVALRPDRR